MGYSMTVAGSTDLLDEVVLGSDGAFTFSAIPNTHRDLVVVGQLRDDAAATAASGPQLRVGATTVDSGATSYDYMVYEGQGDATTVISAESVGTSQITLAATAVGNSATAGLYTQIEFSILRYATTGAFRPVMSSHSSTGWAAADARVGRGGGHWRNTTDAIDIITIAGAGFGSFKAGSYLTLYGRGRL
jgi:hypothetical protein